MSGSGTIHEAVCSRQIIEQFIFPHENNCYLLCCSLLRFFYLGLLPGFLHGRSLSRRKSVSFLYLDLVQLEISAALMSNKMDRFTGRHLASNLRYLGTIQTSSINKLNGTIVHTHNSETWRNREICKPWSFSDHGPGLVVVETFK